ncbi:hypothetical protein KEM54_000306 [Ascosphaera aggregata]|nr:hypothetical protein KEM54_000306 [Ascosphaera aggregata]
MALVSYTDSESSDVEETTSVSTSKIAEVKTSAPTAPRKLVDRSNPRKIVVNLSRSADTEGDVKEELPQNDAARKRPRTGGTGGMFAGFNDLLPAPKRPMQHRLGAGSGAVTARMPFSLRTAAEPSFSRNDVSAAGGSDDAQSTEATVQATEGEVKMKGNPMIFKPLSVASSTAKRRKALSSKRTAAAPTVDVKPLAQVSTTEEKTSEAAPEAAQKPKISLFGLSEKAKDDVGAFSVLSDEGFSYNHETTTTSPGLQLSRTVTQTTEMQQYPSTSTTAATATTLEKAQPQSLVSIAEDLNLSESQKRQLLGRKGAAGKIPSLSDANIVHFNTDQEYAANAAYLASISEQELAAQQHNPVRSIAPGKHSLQQLVNSVQNQRDALEESFASGRRNRKEAGSKYGWVIQHSLLRRATYDGKVSFIGLSHAYPGNVFGVPTIDAKTVHSYGLCWIPQPLPKYAHGD